MTTFYRGNFFHIKNSASQREDSAVVHSSFWKDSAEFIKNGALVVGDDGLIVELGSWSEVKTKAGQKDKVIELPGQLVIPGFIDAHLHFPQINVLGAYGEQLLSWLQRYVFPAEAHFEDAVYAKKMAEIFWQTLLRHGTTMSAVYSSLHAVATDLLFESADQLGVRAIIGKTMMNRLAPESLLESAEDSCNHSLKLYQKWRNHNRLHYAFTPRFAPSCTEDLLEELGKLYEGCPDAYLQTHLSENQEELKIVRELFPKDAHYTGIYQRFGLLGPRTLLGHGIWLNDDELEIIRQTKSVVVHCPLSNLFLGSGLFPLQRVQARGVRVALASDIAAGTSPSMFKVMSGAYSVQQILGYSMHPFELLYMATLGNAEALGLEGRMGNFQTGKEAQFLAIDCDGIEDLRLRINHVGEDIEQIISALIFLGDERIIRETYVLGCLLNKNY